MIADVTRLGEAAGWPTGRPSSAPSWGGGSRRSVRRLRALNEPRLLALEWLDPPFIGGHWIPR
jgi:hypothetical protein